MESLGSENLTPSGHIKVSATLQVKGHPRIFALGDAIEWEEQKQAGKIAGHASVVAANVLVTLGVGKKGLVEYKGAKELIFITNGKV